MGQLRLSGCRRRRLPDALGAPASPGRRRLLLLPLLFIMLALWLCMLYSCAAAAAGSCASAAPPGLLLLGASPPAPRAPGALLSKKLLLLRTPGTAAAAAKGQPLGPPEQDNGGGDDDDDDTDEEGGGGGAGQLSSSGPALLPMAAEKGILCVGLVCLDIISVVDRYPPEDSDSRCLSQRWQRGGNASNTCTVLALLGAPCAFMGSLAPGQAADFVRDDFQRCKVDLAHLVVHPACALPTSVVISNLTSGTRTILHAASNLPDVTAADFEQVNLSQYKWIHWEGRNAPEQVKMLQRVEDHNRTCLPSERVATSVEVEKPRPELYQLFPYGDVVFVSKDVARTLGFSSAHEAVMGLRGHVKPGATVICAWAEEGADAMGPDGVLVHSDAFPPERVVDTLGAGDTFNAAVILSLSRGNPLSAALTYGCQVAGRKCGVHGYAGIV